jgi:hypothetical protein
MKNSSGNAAPEHPGQLPIVVKEKSFHLIIDECRIGPFLAIGPLGCLENLLRLRGVRIAAKIL